MPVIIYYCLFFLSTPSFNLLFESNGLVNIIKRLTKS